MKRDEITALFPEATKEQINTLMAINGADITNARNGVDELRDNLTAATTELEQLRASAEGIDADRQALSAARSELAELKAAVELRDIKEKVSKETGVPVSLLTGSTEEDCTAQANQIMEFAKPHMYPQVHDGGDPGVATAPVDVRTQFKEWFEKISNQ